MALSVYATKWTNRIRRADHIYHHIAYRLEPSAAMCPVFFVFVAEPNDTVSALLENGAVSNKYPFEAETELPITIALSSDTVL